MRDCPELKSCAFEGPHGVATTKSADGDAQCLEAAQNIVQQRLLFQDGEASNPFGQRGEQRQHLDAGEVHADAGVRAGAETQMITWAPKDIEPIGVGVLTLVSVCGPEEHDCPRARGQHHPVHVHVSGHIAGEALDGRVVAQHFLTALGISCGSLRTRSHWSGLFAKAHTAVLIAQIVVSRLGPT